MLYNSAKTLAIALCIIGITADLAQAQNQRRIFTIDGSSNGAQFGYSVRETGDVNRDGFADFAVGAPFENTTNGADSGAAYVFSGRTGVQMYRFIGDATLDMLGFSVTGVGDINKDTYPDILVGAPGPSRGSQIAGYARVYSGFNGSVLLTLQGTVVGDRYGFSVSGSGDINNDSWPDVLIGAPGTEDSLQTGTVHARSGRNGTVLWPLTGNIPHDWFGYAVTGIGDVNGDGFADFAVGAPGTDGGPGLDDAGSAHVYSGKTGTVLRTFSGVLDRSRFGSSLRAAGDVNNDGKGDYVIGAPFERDRGQVHIISGTDYSTIHLTTGLSRSMWYGHAVSGAGDVDGDGWADVVIGAPIDGVTTGMPQATPIQGSVQILSGRTGQTLYTEIGSQDMNWFGWSVGGLGDINGDGRGDFIAGTPNLNNGTGRVQVMSGAALSLQADVHEISVSAGGVQTFSIDATPTYANKVYLLLGSASGTTPGFSLGGVPTPLNPDGWLISTASSPNVFPLGNSLGTMDGSGKAAATLTIPGGFLFALNGLTFHHAYVVWDAGSFLFASNPASVTFVN